MNTEQKQSDTEAARPWNRPVLCPHCDQTFRVEISVNFKPSDELWHDAPPWRDRLDPAQVRLLDEVTETGLLRAFEQAATAAKGGETPTNMEKFFLTFLKTAVPKLVPSAALDFYVAQFPSRRINFLGGQGVLAVLADGAIKCFIPTEYVTGRKVRAANGNGFAIRTEPRMDELVVWRKTRMGYVIDGEMFADELKRISVGEFSKARIEIKNRR